MINELLISFKIKITDNFFNFIEKILNHMENQTHQDYLFNEDHKENESGS